MKDVERLIYRSAMDAHEDWALVRPPAACGVDWVVMLHGHGSSGDQLYTRPDLRERWLPAFETRGLGILTPHLRGNAWMAPAAVADLHALLERVRMEYGARQFLFVSGSMGGTGNLIYSTLYPEDVDGLVAFCPVTDLADYLLWCREQPSPILREIEAAIESAYGGTPSTCAAVYARHSALAHADRLPMPLYLCHGDADTVVPVAQSRHLAAALQQQTGFRYVELSRGDHDAPLAHVDEALAWVLDGNRC